MKTRTHSHSVLAKLRPFLAGMLVVFAFASCDMMEMMDEGPPPVRINSATYNFQSGELRISGSDFVAISGDANDVDVSKLGISPDGGDSKTPFTNSGTVEIQSPNDIRITLTGQDRAAVEDTIYLSELTLHAEVAWNGAHSTSTSNTPITISTHPVDGSLWFELAPNDATAPERWSPRDNFASVVHGGTIIVMGGFGGGSTRFNDVWSSADGVTWTQIDANGNASGMNAPWSARQSHVALVHNGKILVMGGYDGTNSLNDVWSSTDGVTWEQVDANGNASGMNAPWSARQSHAALVHNGKIFVMGGEGTSLVNDVWSSADGVTWEQIDANGDASGMDAPWSARSSHAAIVHGGKIIVMGGSDGAGLNDVWSSTDGVTWRQINANGDASGMNAPWPAKTTPSAALTHNGKIFLLSGRFASIDTADVWLSSDGAESWTQVDANGEERVGIAADWDKRQSHSVVFYDNKLFMFGGLGNSGVLYNDIWMSPVAP